MPCAFIPDTLKTESDAELDIVDRCKCRNRAVSTGRRKLPYLLYSRIAGGKDTLDIGLAVLACFDVSALQCDKILEISCLRLLSYRNEKSVNINGLLAAVFLVYELQA